MNTCLRTLDCSEESSQNCLYSLFFAWSADGYLWRVIHYTILSICVGIHLESSFWRSGSHHCSKWQHFAATSLCLNGIAICSRLRSEAMYKFNVKFNWNKEKFTRDMNILSVVLSPRKHFWRVTGKHHCRSNNHNSKKTPQNRLA